MKMTQECPYPLELERLISNLTYKPGWSFKLHDIDRGQGSGGLTLTITVTVPNSYNPNDTIGIRHLMIVPAAAFDRRSWQRWLLDQILLVESHEACEFFIVDGEHPYAPSHGPGNNPYLIREHGSPIDAATSSSGRVNE